ncbi:MAG: MlaD family protein [Longimicrobiales bacterium]
MSTITREDTDVRGTPAREQGERLDRAIPGQGVRREILVGALALAGILATVIALFTLTDAATFRGRYIVTATVEDAGGLRKGDPVQMRGVNIGRVLDFEMIPGGVAIRLELEGDYRVPEDSRMVLQSSGLLGGRVADIDPGSSPDMLEGGETLAATSATGFSEATQSLTAGADQALMRINALLSEPNVDAVGASVSDLRLTLAQLAALVAEQRGELAAVTASMRGAAANIESTTGELERAEIVADLDRLTAQAGEASASLARASTSLETVLARLENGEGTLGRLLEDESLYENLNEAAASVTALVQDIRQNPRRYFEVRVF